MKKLLAKLPQPAKTQTLQTMSLMQFTIPLAVCTLILLKAAAASYVGYNYIINLVCGKNMF